MGKGNKRREGGEHSSCLRSDCCSATPLLLAPPRSTVSRQVIGEGCSESGLGVNAQRAGHLIADFYFWDCCAFESFTRWEQLEAEGSRRSLLVP